MFSKIILLSTESLVWFLLIISFVLSNRMLADFQTLSPLNDNIKVTNDSEDSKVSSENENSTINSSNGITTIASNSTDSSMVKDSEMIEARSLVRKLINKLRARTRARIQNLIESIRNSRALVNLKDCYDSRYKNMRLNLMEEPIQEILFKYFVSEIFDTLGTNRLNC
ncbi:testis-specific serine/threonine-protein kinase 1 [Sarcoptes scabiei]|nr:testis-specific serine/threonine-protein kinase 1 [Sarcoptes scabiei]